MGCFYDIQCCCSTQIRRLFRRWIAESRENPVAKDPLATTFSGPLSILRPLSIYHGLETQKKLLYITCVQIVTCRSCPTTCGHLKTYSRSEHVGILHITNRGLGVPGTPCHPYMDKYHMPFWWCYSGWFLPPRKPEGRVFALLFIWCGIGDI